jgi:hypothetical protein
MELLVPGKNAHTLKPTTITAKSARRRIGLVFAGVAT